jgi:hypothetical protein
LVNTWIVPCQGSRTTGSRAPNKRREGLHELPVPSWI